MDKNPYIVQVINIFNNNEINTSHHLIQDIMKKMVSDKSFLFQVIENNLNNPSFLKQTRHYPTLSLKVFKNDLIDIVINIFPNLPDQNLNISFQSIHSHGNLKLSIIGLSGSGYTSFLFSPNYTRNETTNETDLTITKQYQNEVGQYTFCDSFVPHVVFFPESFSSTLAIWSKSEKQNLNKIKNIIPKSIKKILSNILSSLGFRKVLAINTALYHDFYPENNKIYALKNRIGYPEGTNENFIQNIFHYFQSVGYSNDTFLADLKDKETTSPTASKWITKLLQNETIDSDFEPSHLNIKFVNIHKEDIVNACK